MDENKKDWAQDERDSGIGYAGRGVGRLLSSFVVFALGCGVSVWIGIGIEAHNFQHQLEQERRSATYVGAVPRPKDKIKITARESKCTHVLRADYDNGKLIIIAQRTCDVSGYGAKYTYWKYNLVSPNGTVIQSGGTNYSCPELSVGDKAECSMDVRNDDRASEIVVWVEGS